jgi:hypothetical protein
MNIKPMKIAQHKNIETIFRRFINVKKLTEKVNLLLLLLSKFRKNYSLLFNVKNKSSLAFEVYFLRLMMFNSSNSF